MSLTLQTRLILIFVLATALPLAAALWISTRLVEHSLSYSSSAELDRLSRSVQTLGREYLQSEQESLKSAALSGRIASRFVPRAELRDDLARFWSGGAPEQFERSSGKRLDLIERRPGGVAIYSRPLDVDLDQFSARYRSARELVTRERSRDLRRGYVTTLIVLTAAIWALSLAVLLYVARRIGRPVRSLTAGLSELAAGNLAARLEPGGPDEIGLATLAFNRTAAQLERSRDRLIYLTQVASWQVLASKTAHEVKNSLTPIRLTVEEMVARFADPPTPGRRAFLEQAAHIVVEEIESLERCVRAFSEFSSEPPVLAEPLDINAVVAERIAFLRSSHPEIEYAVNLAEHAPCALADQDLVRSILMNLLENAAEAAGAGGRVLARTAMLTDRVSIEVHDSGPGLSEQARRSLFQPTISFKKRGMGLGLSIARKSAIAVGGDISLVTGELGGAAFRVLLPPAVSHEPETYSHR